MKCTICGNDINKEIFCNNCGFERITISESASEALKEFLTQKTDNHRKHYKNVLLVNSKLNELQSELKKAKKEITELSKINNDLEKKIKATEGKVLVTQKEINELLVFKTEYENQKTIIIDLQSEVKSYKSKMKNIVDYDKIKKQRDAFMAALEACHPNRFNELKNKFY